MLRQFFPVQDASVYQEFDERNTGQDEILEVGKDATGQYAIRSLITFDMDDVATTAPSASQYILHLKTAIAKRLPVNQMVQLSLYTGSWQEGSGIFYHDEYQVADGVVWTDAAGTYSPSMLVSASTSGTLKWTDLSIDVTGLLSGSEGWQTLLMQWPSASEADDSNKGVVRFFSRQSHTVYQPTLECRWTQQSYATGSLSSSAGINYVAIPHNLRAVYTQGETVRVDIAVREKYPQKSFSNALSLYTSKLYLPATSYFSVVDETTGFAVIPFSDATRIHQTATGAYLSFVVENMWARRFYRIVIKAVAADGSETIFDNRHIFKVAD